MTTTKTARPRLRQAVIDQLITLGDWTCPAELQHLIPGSSEDSIDRTLYRLRAEGLAISRTIELAYSPDGHRLECRHEWKFIGQVEWD